MKKKNFVTLILSVIGGLLFALGMCMALLPQWNAFVPGIVTGVLGAAVLLAMALIRRRMDGKPRVALSGRTLGAALLGVLGAIVLGVGMCLCMVWGRMVWGIAVGILGIALLLCLIPAVKGLK